MSDSYLISKERCPSCAELGKDTSSDNLAVLVLRWAMIQLLIISPYIVMVILGVLLVGTAQLEILLDHLLLGTPLVYQ